VELGPSKSISGASLTALMEMVEVATLLA